MRRFARPPVWFAALLVALAAGCASGQSDGPRDDPGGAATETAAGVTQDLAWYDAEEMAAAQDDTAVVWLAGWFVPEALEGVTVADLEVRYRKASGLPPEPSAAQLAQAAFAAMADPGPVELLNPLEGVTLRLRSARVEDRGGVSTAVLDFDEGIGATNRLGIDAADAEAQFHAMVAECFPDAAQVVVTVEGVAAELFDGKPYGEPVALAG